jgi:GT2 family glycosyltransferase
VVVVDNGSTDATAEVALGFRGQLPGLRVVSEPRAGEGFARNRGLAEADGDLVAFTDADCVPREDWLEAAVGALRACPDCAAVAGEVAGDRPRRVVEKYLTVAAFPTPPAAQTVASLSLPPPTFYTANLVVRREVLDRLGGFDPDLRVGLDVDLCVRLLRAGFRILYEPRAVVAHVHRDSWRKAARRLFQYGAGLPAWYRKHAEPGLCLTLPGRRVVRVSRVRRPAWVNLSAPDRVVLALGLLATQEPWVAALLFGYLGRIAWRLRQVARRRGVHLSPWELGLATVLHVAEFAVFTAGTVTGSVRQRIVCVV